MNTFDPLNDGRYINMALWRWNHQHPDRPLRDRGPGTPYLPEPWVPWNHMSQPTEAEIRARYEQLQEPK